MMYGYLPQSNDFMFQDPEHIDEYREWQRFARLLAAEQKTKLRQAGNRNRFVLRQARCHKDK